ncbi:hypothetical protein [Pseudorhodoferax sp. Leaf267]|uniref:hypothetical protein n=1 Tax=Pseudorhodoferax sp. Leaf267 TaxID=1736316 RepID=UPI00070060B3|nr:hypothetical protein [Pseudorhodoferax sp. Leaf267]KQP18075.1 hypothetical protein ASF43_09510 [Pseudorhodoferax sp. Leaf267]
MSNPWLKKNPLMSMWLSAANSVAGSARGHATAQVKRASKTATTKATRNLLDLWTLAPASNRKRRR